MLLSSIAPASKAGSYEKTNPFQAQFSIDNHKLYVSVPPSLFNYYGNMSHTVNGDGDYPSFVTPQAVEPIAENIQNVTGNLPHSTEQFANAVLSLVHQIPYAINNTQYPIETLVYNSGDCVALSLLAASIMQAGGLDVVLIHYIGISPSHMNVGVSLPSTPYYHTAGLAPTSFVYDNKTYWTAETTAEADWKVGDQSDTLAGATPVIIPLNGSEPSSPAQVSSSLDASLLPSSITINLSQEQSNPGISQEQLSFEGYTRSLTVNGSISPAYSGGNVSLYVSRGSSYNYFTTATDDVGGYMFTWNFTSAGTYYVTASWSGASNCTGADSETLTVFVGPESFVQFNDYGYNYIFLEYAQASLAAYEVRPLEGVNDFLSIPLGANVSISYDFTILQAGHTVSNVQTQTVTIPASERTISLGRNSPTFVISTPAKTMTVPVDPPQDLSPVALPDDFNQTINDQFCFIVQNSGGNCSLNVNALNDYEISNVTEGSGGTSAFMNASATTQQDTWYHVTESVSENGVIADLYTENGALIKNTVAPNSATGNNETVMLLTNNLDSAVILKDLTVKALNSTTQPPMNAKPTNYGGLLLPYVSLSLLLVASFAAAVYVKKKMQMSDKSRKAEK